MTRRDAAKTLTIAWVVLLLAVLGVGWLITHPLQSSVDPWDNGFETWLEDHRTPGLDVAAAWGSHVADTVVGVPLAAVIALILWRWQHTTRPLVYFGILVGGTLVLYLIVTHFVLRDRPPVKILDPGLVPDHSYPSGHVATSIVVYCAAGLYLMLTAPATRRWAWVLFLAPLIVMPSRLYEGAHHPTDVITSLLFASAWVAVVAHVLIGPRAPD